MNKAVIKKSNARVVNQKKMLGNMLAEYGLLLVILAVALAGIIGYFASNSTAGSAKDLSTDVVSLMAKVKQNYGNAPATVTNVKLSTGGFFKNLTSFTDASGAVTLTIGGGGTLTVAPGTIVNPNDSISYTLTNIPDEACLPFATTIARNVTKLTVGSKTVKPVGGQADPSQVQCSGNANTFTLYQY